ncbi:MAG: recombination mediator RecR [Pseudomonadota bacterium]|jgi:recombination protein RecR|nr:recombination mediator RecR [Pseudomonadota bacterium]MED6343937.1 recombination mediator RecR [Pseudomonadota bacterium]|tara:strand:+ start:176 stop:784 length:609 start_codon:yes stop_codon:yes gene_type:complete
MKHFSPILQDLVNAFKGLPGIGVKSAQRIVFNLIQQNQEKALFLSDAIKNALDNINECSNCRMYTDSEVCEICSDQKRDSALLCVIESPADMIAIENSMSFNGRYFVLMGKLSPLDGIGPDQLKLDKLESIIKDGSVKEIILANSPTIEGEATASYILSLIEDTDIEATRIAYGVPMGGELEYVDSSTLTQALNNRSLVTKK